MKKLMSAITAFLLTISLTACGIKDKTITNYTIEISNQDGSNCISYTTYDNGKDAKENPIIYNATKEDFPISVKISTSRSDVDEYVFSSYGEKCIVNYAPFFSAYVSSCAQLMIEPYPEEAETVNEEAETASGEIPKDDSAEAVDPANAVSGNGLTEGE